MSQPSLALELVVADALPQEGFTEHLIEGLNLPNLATLAARGRRRPEHEIARTPGLTAWQGYVWRGERSANLARWWAPLLDVDAAAGAASLWLMEPVRLEVGLDKVTLGDPALLALEAEHSEALADIAAQVLAGHGWRVIAASPLRWLGVRSDALKLSGCAIDCAINADVIPFLPTGDAPAERAWRVAHNELQMTWFETGANQAREAQGLPAINGLWLSGNGRADPARLPYAQVSCDLPYLAQAARAPDAHDALEVVTSLSAPARSADWYAWRTALEALDRRVGDALDALKRGALRRIDLVLAGSDDVRVFTLERAQLRRFWRRAQASLLWQGWT
jgi:hypothetical protein